MPVCGEGRRIGIKQRTWSETETISNCYSPDLSARTRTRRNKALLQLLWWSDLWRKSCQPKEKENTTNLTDLCRADRVTWRVRSALGDFEMSAWRDETTSFLLAMHTKRDTSVAIGNAKHYLAEVRDWDDG